MPNISSITHLLPLGIGRKAQKYSLAARSHGNEHCHLSLRKLHDTVYSGAEKQTIQYGWYSRYAMKVNSNF